MAPAFVALRQGQSASEEELLAFSRQHVAEYNGPTGKVQRRALKELRADGVAARLGH